MYQFLLVVVMFNKQMSFTGLLIKAVSVVASFWVSISSSFLMHLLMNSSTALISICFLQLNRSVHHGYHWITIKQLYKQQICSA